MLSKRARAKHGPTSFRPEGSKIDPVDGDDDSGKLLSGQGKGSKRTIIPLSLLGELGEVDRLVSLLAIHCRKVVSLEEGGRPGARGWGNGGRRDLRRQTRASAEDESRAILVS